jgi:hypothetical protein
VWGRWVGWGTRGVGVGCAISRQWPGLPYPADRGVPYPRQGAGGVRAVTSHP